MAVELKDELTRLKGFIFQGAASGMKYAAHGTSIMTGRRAVQPFLSQITATRKGAWGMVKMESAPPGACCRVRRSSDNAELDIPFSADGIVDSDRMRSFMRGDQYLYLVTLYDQTANGYNATQATQANQPKLDMSYIRNGMPGIVSSATYLTLPSGVAITSTANCAVWTAVGNFNTQAAAVPWCFGTAGQFELSMSPSSAFSVQPKLSSTFLNFGTNMNTIPNANGCVVGLNSSASAMTLFRNNASYTRAALTGAGTQVIATTGGTIGTPGTALTDIYGLVLFDVALSTEESAFLQYAMTQAYSAVLVPRANFVLHGDSIVKGTDDMGHTYVKALMSHFGSNVTMHSLGVGGQLMQTMATAAQVNNRAGPLFRSGIPNIAVLMGGTNDVTTGRTAAQMYADALAWTTAMKGFGFITVVQTLFPRPLGSTGAGTVTQDMVDRRNAFNALVRANCGAGKELADYCIDVQNELSLATVINTTDFPDGQHPANSGYVKIAAVQANTFYQYLPAAVQ